MPNPAKRHSETRRNKRRSHDFLAQPATSACPQCNEPKLPHHAYPHCGAYKGREIITLEKIS